MNELVKLSKPNLPIYWEYGNSIKFVSENIFKWKNITEDIAKELWIAREILRSQGKRTDLTSDQLIQSWSEYCEEIGSSRGVVNKWLKQWFEIVHVSNNSGENEWYTPPKLIELASRVMNGIDLDPASSELANGIVKAGNYYTAEDDGLTKDWDGNIWMNPPYAQPLITQFSEKLVNELPNINQACVLVNNATETGWLQGMMRKCDAICFLTGRVKFIDTDGNSTGAPLQGQVVLYFGENVNGFYNEFKGQGICMMRLEEEK